MRQYGRYLREQVGAGGLAGSTAITYWNYIVLFSAGASTRNLSPGITRASIDTQETTYQREVSVA